MSSNIIADHDMILSLLRFLDPNPGSHKRNVTAPPLTAGRQVLFTVTVMESHTLLLL